MQKITIISGKAIPLAMDDVDTDLIIPAQYLTAVTKDGYGEHLFRRSREKDPHFVFNRPEFLGANILITLHNFGCGSSREHAVWALQQAGIQAIIAVSFADIFASNSGKNGLVLIRLPEDTIQELLMLAETGCFHLTIDIRNQKIASEPVQNLARLGEKVEILNRLSETRVYNFALDPFQQYCFIHGLDDLDYLLSYQTAIDAYDARQRTQ